MLDSAFTFQYIRYIKYLSDINIQHFYSISYAFKNKNMDIAHLTKHNIKIKYSCNSEIMIQNYKKIFIFQFSSHINKKTNKSFFTTDVVKCLHYRID